MQINKQSNTQSLPYIWHKGTRRMDHSRIFVHTCKSTSIFPSQVLRSALLIFTLGIVRRIFVILVHCHLLDFDSYAPCNDVIFSPKQVISYHNLPFRTTKLQFRTITRNHFVPYEFCTITISYHMYFAP